MNVIFVTQTAGLNLFYSLMKKLENPLSFDKVGFYVAESMYYDSFCKKYPDFESGTYNILKEWIITREAKHEKPDIDLITRYEKAIGNPTLWGPLVCDRRIYLGRRCKQRQDYHPRFTHDEMLNILQVALVNIERQFEEVQPDIVFSLVPVTFGDYLYYLFAKAKEIPILFIATTKIKNYVSLFSDIFGCPQHILEGYRQYEAGQYHDNWLAEAEEYIQSVRSEHVRYEGMILLSGKAGKQPGKFKNLFSGMSKLLKREFNYIFGEYKQDNHIPGIFMPILYSKFLSPLKGKYINASLSKHYLSETDLRSINYVFYPLHSEPEIALTIHGKPYQNQIEVIRNISQNIPVGMKLVVKEHPRSIGYRPRGYYRKILEIPNVLLSNPYLESKVLVQNAEIVVTVSGFVGFEAIMFQKPIITLGYRPFNMLPDSIIRQVKDLNRLGIEIKDLMENYEYIEKSVINYVAATIRESVPVDFYSKLLGKKKRYGGDKDEEGYEHLYDLPDLELLAKYTIQRIKEVCPTT